MNLHYQHRTYRNKVGNTAVHSNEVPVLLFCHYRGRCLSNSGEHVKVNHNSALRALMIYSHV